MSIKSSFWRLANSGKFFMAGMKMPSCLVAVSGFLCLLGASQNAGATNYYNWGVESLRVDYGVNGPGIFDVAFKPNSTMDCTSGVAHSGKCAMRLNVIGNDGGNQQMGADMIQQNRAYPFNLVGAPSIYNRWWMKIMPGFSWGPSLAAKSKTSRIISGVQGYTGYMMNYGFLIGECDSAGCSLNTGASNGADCCLVILYDFKTKNDGLWHEYIVRIKPNTNANCTAPINCDGEFQAWVDGFLVGQYNGFKLHNNASDGMVQAWGGWMDYPFFQMNGTTADGGTIYLDDFSTDDSWNSLIPRSPFSGPLPPVSNPRVR